MDFKESEHLDPNLKPEFEFLDSMVQKCEVRNYSELFLCLVKKKGDIVRCEEIFQENPKFSMDKICYHVKGIDDLIVLGLYDPKEKNSTQKLNKINYLLNFEGFSRVIKAYRSENYIPNSIEISELEKIFEIKEEFLPSFEKMINKIIETKTIPAILQTSNDIKNTKIIHFQTIMEIPHKKKTIIQLGITIITFVAILLLLLKLTNNY
jgi:hypothetical protein